MHVLPDVRAPRTLGPLQMIKFGREFRCTVCIIEVPFDVIEPNGEEASRRGVQRIGQRFSGHFRKESSVVLVDK